MGKISTLISAFGFALSGFAIFRIRKEEKGEIPKMLYIGIAIIIIGSVLTAFEI